MRPPSISLPELGCGGEEQRSRGLCPSSLVFVIVKMSWKLAPDEGPPLLHELNSITINMCKTVNALKKVVSLALMNQKKSAQSCQPNWGDMS